jgi:hypothetical protein
MALAILAALVCLAIDAKPVAKGLVLGTLFSVINFVLMAALLPLRLEKRRRRATLISLGSIGSRYILLAVPLVIAVRMEAVDFIAAAAGLFAVQAVLVGEHFSRMVFKRD